MDRRAVIVVAALLALPVRGAAAQSMEGTPQGGEAGPSGTRPYRTPRAAPPASGSDQAPSQGVQGNGPFNNQLRKFSDPLGANGR